MKPLLGSLCLALALLLPNVAAAEERTQSNAPEQQSPRPHAARLACPDGQMRNPETRECVDESEHIQRSCNSRGECQIIAGSVQGLRAGLTVGSQEESSRRVGGLGREEEANTSSENGDSTSSTGQNTPQDGTDPDPDSDEDVDDDLDRDG